MHVNFQDNSDLFNVLIEESEMPIALYVGENFVIQVANKAILKAWGKNDSIKGQELAMALPELSGQPFIQILKNVFESGRPYEAKEDKVELINDGVLQTFYFDFIYKPLKDKSGKVWAILNNATNVTELVMAKLKGKESEELFRQMIYDAPVAIGILRGPEFIIEDANDELLKIWGKKKNILGLKVIDGLPEIINQPFPELLKNVYQDGEPHYGYEMLARIEHEGILGDYYFNFVYDPIRNKNKEVTGIMIVANEVTAQVKSRNAFKQSEERFRNLVLENPMPTALYETENFIVKIANKEMLKLWGKDKSILGKFIIDGIPELEGQTSFDILKEVFRSGIPYHADQQAANLFIDGQLQKRWFNFTYKPIRNTEGEVYAILHSTIDVTNLIQLQQQKDEFLGIASHELKTPVTSIKAYAQVLERMIRNDGDEKKADMVQKMDLQLNRLTGLIGDLLDVTKIQSGKMTFNPSKFDFDLLIKDMVEDMQYTTAKYEFNLDLNANTVVYADKERIGQVVINFLSNAVKYASDSGGIEVRSYLQNDEVILCVQDYGVGIAKDLHHLVFDQFYRVERNQQHTYSGLGLGLFISAEIIKSEGGRIWLDSDEGKGASFYFALKL